MTSTTFDAFIQSTPLTFQVSDERNDPNGRFVLDIYVPTEQPDLASVADLFAVIERKVRASVLLAFLDDVPDSEVDLAGMLAEFPRLPLAVTRLSISSVKVTVEGDPGEVAIFLLRQEPRRDWRKRLVVAALLVFSAFGTKPPVTTPLPNLREQAAQVCGVLPLGSEVTLKFMDQEIKFPCGDDSQALVSTATPSAAAKSSRTEGNAPAAGRKSTSIPKKSR